MHWVWRQLRAAMHALQLPPRVPAQPLSAEMVSEAAGVGLWTFDRATDLVTWNRRMFSIYGLPPDGGPPSLEHWISTLVHPDDREELRRRQHSLKSGDACFETEFRIVRPDGSVRHVVCSSRRELHEGHLIACGLNVDVTDQRAAERALAQTRERVAAAAEVAGVGVWERDIENGVSYWDAQMYRLRGLSPDDPRSPNQVRIDTVHPDDIDEALRQVDAFAEGAPHEHEFRIIWPDGTVRWLAMRGRPLRDAQGKPYRLLGVNWDITERKEAEQARRDQAHAEQANRAKSDFLARVSHELRTPLNAVLGFARLLEEDPLNPPSHRQQERVDRILTAGHHLLALIDDMLDLSSIEAGVLQVNSGPTPVQPVIAEAMQWVQPMAQRAGVALHASHSEAWVWADTRRLRQVLVNLLSNAIQYNKQGGEVRITVRSGERQGTAGWSLAISDTGRGLTEAQRNRLFEPFNPVGADASGVRRAGIGLSITHQLVRVMDGTIDVSSTPGTGSEFRVWLRAAPRRSLQTTPERAAPAPDDLPALRLIYIEDNAVNVLLMEEFVTMRSNVSLHCALTGEAGVTLAQELRPDAVLIDMQLPDFDGFEVLRRLRADPALEGTRCIAVSANAMPADVAHAREAGFDDYWTKPIDLPRFLRELDALAMQVA